MPIKQKYETDFYLKDDCIYLSTEYLSKNKNLFKKITGKRLAAILNKNQYTSPLKTWMEMTNLYYEEMDKTLATVGNIIEPKIIAYLAKKFNINYKQHNPFAIKWDVFKENKIFGGIPDGEPVDENDNYLYDKNYPMLEIKTSSIDSLVYKKVDGVLTLQKDENNIPLVKIEKGKFNEWFDANNKLIVPIEYQLQICLYLYLRNVNNGLIAIAFLEKQDYAFPNEFDVNNRQIYVQKINLDLDKFKPVIELASNWYQKHIVSGISPKLNNVDLIWFNNLVNQIN